MPARRKSSKKSRAGKKNPWIKSVMKARKELGTTGFVVINRGAEGKRLYKLAKKYHEQCN